MTTEEITQAIEKIQNTQNNIKVFTAIPMGLLLIVYFFSYATLIDHGYSGFLVFEIITSILFVLAFIFLNSLSFHVVKWIYRKHSPHKEIIQQLTPETIVKPAESLCNAIQLDKIPEGTT